MKNVKPIAVHLDRLAAALAAQGIDLKRSQLLEVASAAFGHRSSNETSALAAAGELTPPNAQPICRVDMGSDSVIVVRDMNTGLPYGIASSVLADMSADRAGQFGVTPYGGLNDLRRVAASDVPPFSELRIGTAGAYVAVVQTGDGEHGHTFFVEGTARALATEIAAWCVEHWPTARERVATLPEKTEGLSDLEVIEGYFTAWSGVEHLMMPDGGGLSSVLDDLRNDQEPAMDDVATSNVKDGRFRAHAATRDASGPPDESSFTSCHDTLEEAIAACEAARDEYRDAAVVDHVGRVYWRAMRRWEPQSMPALARSDDESVTTFHLDARSMDDDELGDELRRIAGLVLKGCREGEIDGGWWWRILGEPHDTDETCVRCDTVLLSNGRCKDETCPFSECDQDDERGWAGHPDRDHEAE